MTILCYHTVEPDWKSTLALEPAVFDAHCAWLAKNRDVVSLETALDRLDRKFRPQGRTTALTFDDGWKGVFDHAWPILRRHGLPFTIFVIANSMTDAGASFGWVDNPPDQPLTLMTMDQVLELHDDGVTIASHSLAHHDLRELGPDECVRDLRESREIIEDVLREPIRTLAYLKTRRRYLDARLSPHYPNR